MTTYCVFDVSNLVYRIAMMTNGGRGEEEDLVNLALATSIRSMRVPFDMFGADHAVMCFDHASWRKAVYAKYKSSRAVAEDAKPAEIELRDGIARAIDGFREFLSENSNCTVLWARGCEADDLIARWVARHPQATNVLVSTDSDFKQLVAGQVHLYNPTSGTLYSGNGIYESQTKKKAKRGEPTAELFGQIWRVPLGEDGKPEAFSGEWELFKKIMLGDRSDDIDRAAPPRTLNRVLQEAFNHWGGVAWTTLMETRRADLGEAAPTVAEVYERNRGLIDLTQLPPEVVAVADAEIDRATGLPPKSSLGMKFMIYCRQRSMVSLGGDAERYVPMLSSHYR